MQRVTKLAKSGHLSGEKIKYDHRPDNDAVEFKSLLYKFQPWVAMLGCLCTALIAFLFSTAVFWEEDKNAWQAFPIFFWASLDLIASLSRHRANMIRLHS